VYPPVTSYPDTCARDQRDRHPRVGDPDRAEAQERGTDASGGRSRSDPVLEKTQTLLLDRVTANWASGEAVVVTALEELIKSPRGRTRRPGRSQAQLGRVDNGDLQGFAVVSGQLSDRGACCRPGRKPPRVTTKQTLSQLPGPWRKITGLLGTGALILPTPPRSLTIPDP
jgi:hypothetical protein